MTTIQPTIVQGRVNVLGIIRALLHGYSGGITIIREMAQNADDVPGDDERWLEFHFQPDCLIIKNSTVFRPIDFENINSIAHGGKRLEQRRTIGMFGVGFLSVYQLTDTPMIRSNGIEQRMEPREDAFPIYQDSSPVTNHTEFKLPYRRERTRVGDQLGMPQVTDEWISQILADLPGEAYRLLFFLRRLRRIAVYQNGQRISEVTRTIEPDSEGIERLVIQAQRGTATPTRHTWLRFSTLVPGEAPLREDRQPAKDRQVQIVIPDADVPEDLVRGQDVGRLYNYLPTDILTGLPFQINGDFYPSTDRKSIDNDHPNHRDWNSRVLHALGECVAEALPTLLDRLTQTPLLLYQRIDTRNARPLVEPIVDRLYQAAHPLPIFHTTGGWVQAAAARWVHPQLRQVVEGTSPQIMSAALQEAAAPLIERLGVPEFSFGDLLAQIRRDIADGDLLSAGPAYLHNDVQLNRLYATLDTDIAQGYEEQIQAAPLFLDHTGRVWPAGACVRSPDTTLREHLAASGLCFWVGDPERYRRAAHMVEQFTLSHLWEVLRKQLTPDTPLANAPEWLNSPTKLYRLYRTILRTKEQPNKSEVANLPLCLNRQRCLCPPTKLRRPVGDPTLYEIFADELDIPSPSSTPLIAKEIYDQPDLRSLYEDLGVPPFHLEDLFNRLGKLAREELPLAQAHPCLNSREKLLRLYRYLRDKRSSLAKEQVENLRHRLPIWLCRDGRLRRAKELTLPPENTDLPPGITLNNVLDLQTGDLLQTFLKEVIGLQPLGMGQLVIQLIPQYRALERAQQMDAQRYLRDYLGSIRQDEHALNQLKQTPLIYGEDDRLHRADELCFPRTQGYALFQPDLYEIHAGLYAPPPSDLTKWIWYDFFRALGIGSYPSHVVVLKTIQVLTTQRPQGQTRDQIEKIFRFLEDNWERWYEETGLGNQLAALAWLPGDGDEQKWYRPSDLYMRLDKALVGYVKTVLGFTQSQRPKTSIAEALKFPSHISAQILVQQLRELSRRKEAVSTYFYQELARKIEKNVELLKQLKGYDVIYTDKRFWRADQIFVTDQQQHFGRYRGYLTQTEMRDLLLNLDAKKQPDDKDFVELLRDIGNNHRSCVPKEDLALIHNAYRHLVSAEERVIETLKTVPCVLIHASNQDGQSDCYELCRPDRAILIPPDRYHKHIPDLPVAQYDLQGEQLLRRIGVRRIEEVIRVEFALTPDHTRPHDLAPIFAKLDYPIRRLLHHAKRDLAQEETSVLDLLARLKCYYQRAIQVTYQVQLGDQIYTSALINEASYYDPEQHLIYLRDGLKQDDKWRELARVLRQIPALSGCSLLLLKTLLAEPENARTMLDDEGIIPLPADLDLAPVEVTVEHMTLGDPDLPASADDETATPPPAQPAPLETSRAQPHKRPFPTPTGGAPQPAAGLNDVPDRTGHQQRSGMATESNGVSKGTSRPASADSATSDALHTNQRSASSSQPQHVESPSPSSTRTPTPLRDPSAPPFEGSSTLSSPRLATDYDGLADRVRRWAEKHGHATEHSEPAPAVPPPARRWRLPPEPVETNEARFILSFPEVMQGFLWLTGQARNLFLARPTAVECHTDFRHTFTLWLDWSRNTPIAYNQQALRDFFLDQCIPAGGIVYLERIHADSFRLYYNNAPHKVREVRIASNEQGAVCYELLDEVEVRCETDEAIYRAEKRFEDESALWLEAVGKKSVLETLCDLLMAAPEGWVHQNDLRAMLGAVRMVSADTVEQALKQNSAFVNDGQGYWRLDPAALLNTARNQPVERWCKASNALLACDNELLQAAHPTLHPLLVELHSRLLSQEITVTQATPVEETGLQEQVRHEVRNPVPDNTEIAVTQAAPVDETGLQEQVRYEVRNPVPDNTLLFDVQAALRQPEPNHWLSRSRNEERAAAFISTVKEVVAAHQQLDHAQQPAFERMVLEQARRLWTELDQHGKLRLLLWLRPIIPGSLDLNEQELRHLLDIACAHQGTLNGLLIGHAAWQLCPSQHPIQPEIAAYLARCYGSLGLWEQIHTMPWKTKLDRGLLEELQRAQQRTTRSQHEREMARLRELEQPDHSPLGKTLVEDRANLLRRWKKNLR